MKFFKKRTNEDTGYEDDFYDEDYYATSAKDNSAFDGEAEPVEETRQAAGVSFAGGSASVALKVVKPESYDEGPEIADYIAGGSTVLLNIELLDKNSTKRLLDFLLGATHVLGGTMNMVARGTFVFAPRSVGISDLTGASAEPADEPTATD